MPDDTVQLLRSLVGFEWDAGNRTKNWLKHQVSQEEAEQVFFNPPLAISKDEEHSQDEDRYAAYGITNAQRPLFVVFTIRNHRLRVISARDQDKQERRAYEQKTTQAA